jgi:RNA polymerase sigma-70 factor, ECF subfamily
MDMVEAVPTPEEDRTLVEAFRREGDERAFQTLFARHGPALYALALRLMGGPGREAEDVVQETWVRAIAGLDGFGWRSALRTWLFGIAIHTAREMLRRRTPGFPCEEENALRAPLRLYAERLDLERAIARLPDGYRAILVLHDVVGLTHAEIGERLGIAAGTSKSQLAHARRALRRLWSAEPPEKE